MSDEIPAERLVVRAGEHRPPERQSSVPPDPDPHADVPGDLVIQRKPDTTGWFITAKSVPGLFLWGHDLPALLRDVPIVAAELRRLNGSPA